LTDSGADDQEINNVWQQAIQAHSAADNDARAAEIWQTLGEIEKAAELYKRANKTEQAADLYEKGQSWVQAAELWRQLKRHDKEAENLEKQANKVDKGPANKQKKQEAWRASAQAYEKANQPLKAAEIWHEKVGDTTKAAVVCQTAGKPEEAAELYEAIKEWAVAASLWGQLEKFRRQALALQEHALTVAASNGDAKDKELAWTVAAEVFDKTGDTKASELCKQEAARHRPQDDLTQISGIGGRTARILNQAGIYTFVQLANTSAADVQEILRKATDKRTRIRFQASWLEQAQKLAGLESQPGLEQKNNQRKLSQQRETSSKRQEKPRIEESLSAPTPKQLRDFINSYFDESELIAFCFDYFPEMYDGFSGKMSKTTKIMTLIEYCRQRNLMEDLLVSLQQERETQYQQTFAPRERQKPISPSPEPESTAKKCAATTKSGSRCRNWALDNSEYCGVHIKKLGISGDDTFIHEKTGLEFVRIPAGKFKYGGDGDKEGEKRIIDLPEYWISKTPVTNAIYKKFIDANPEYRLPKTLLGGFANWDKRKRTYPPKQSQHPVTLVSWSDAVAFCKWADLSLPTEEQWEKAARGRDGRKYPWGNDHPTDKLCNFNRNVDQTTPVGDYSPQGDSPYGCVDMGSNVREWCLNKYDTPEDISVSEGKASWTDAARVSRGGSWYNGSDNVRAAYRDRCAPDDRFNGIGFRVVAAHRSSFH
ncbi:MAG: SUMF1/EgtB/PvdO family nonheme iron enzyme, partial [Chloroflexi bacterium]|nr:SUMF1/EgtB/PvdO family nonheme iron enzyme [Chloroflexota bacterium]